MDNFACKSNLDKQPYFETVAGKMGLNVDIVEKNFWVCWTLKRLFSLPYISEHLIFKGGTSLSKVYKLIERFSEDVDITINKTILGINIDNFSEIGASNKKLKLALAHLANQCSDFVQNNLITLLEHEFAKCLDKLGENFKLEIDANDPDGQSILFHYPVANTKQSNSYIKRIVKIEMGARGELWPSSNKQISPFIGELIPNLLDEPSISINVLDVQRTFWEKALILHKFANFPPDKTIPERQSRHYYDFYKLLSSKVKDSAVNDHVLLEQVVEHNKIYFRAAWANYESAKKGSLKLTPEKFVTEAMENDYEKMGDMFYGQHVDWQQIISQISEFEHQFNNKIQK